MQPSGADVTASPSQNGVGVTRRLPLLGLGIALVNVVVASGVLVLLDESLLRRHRPGIDGVGMGQGIGGQDGLASGRDGAEASIATWEEWAALPESAGANSWETIATAWLVVDIVVFAAAGYGLLGAMVILLATGGRDGWAAAPLRRRAWGVWGVALLVLFAADVVETIAALVVVWSGGEAFAGVLALATDAKWVVATVGLLALVIALVVSVAHVATYIRARRT